MVAAASPALLARMLEHTPPADIVRFLWRPLFDDEGAAATRVTRLGCSVSDGISPSPPSSEREVDPLHPHAVALRRTRVSTLAAMSMVLPASEAAPLASILGASRLAQVLVETTAQHGTWWCGAPS